MKILSLFLVIVFLLSCTTIAQEKSNPLEGMTWELTSGEWSRGDTTFTFPNSPYDRYILIFGKTHYSSVGQDTSRNVSSSQVGTYSIDEDNITFTAEMYSYYADIGKPFTWKYQIEGDQLIFKATDFHFVGHDWKELHEVYKRID